MKPAAHAAPKRFGQPHFAERPKGPFSEMTRKRAMKSFQKGPLVHILSGGKLPSGVKFPDALAPREEPYRLFRVQVAPGRLIGRPGFRLHEVSVSPDAPDLAPNNKALINISHAIGTGETALVVYGGTIGLLRPFGPHHRLVEIYAKNEKGHLQVFGHPEEPTGQARAKFMAGANARKIRRVA